MPSVPSGTHQAGSPSLCGWAPPSPGEGSLRPTPALAQLTWSPGSPARFTCGFPGAPPLLLTPLTFEGGLGYLFRTEDTTVSRLLCEPGQSQVGPARRRRRGFLFPPAPHQLPRPPSRAPRTICEPAVGAGLSPEACPDPASSDSRKSV